MANRNKRVDEILRRLERVGISYTDAERLRRISMTLSAWSEMECGSDRGAIERDETTGKPYFRNAYTGKRSRLPVADKEAGALRRLASIMLRYPGLLAYHQTDPRGAALYILQPSDVPAGIPLDCCYSRGIAVWKGY